MRAGSAAMRCAKANSSESFRVATALHRRAPSKNTRILHAAENGLLRFRFHRDSRKIDTVGAFCVGWIEAHCSVQGMFGQNIAYVIDGTAH